MKKLFFVLALVCSLQLAYAQKPDEEMQKAVDKALAAAQDAKKATKSATWMNLGKAYMTAYNNPISNIAPGLDKATFGMMNKEQPISVSNVTVGGEAYEKMQLSHLDVYFNGAGLLAIVDVTKPSVPGDLLGEAGKAYVKAFELGAKDKDIAPKLKEIADAYGEAQKLADNVMGEIICSEIDEDENCIDRAVFYPENIQCWWWQSAIRGESLKEIIQQAVKHEFRHAEQIQALREIGGSDLVMKVVHVEVRTPYSKRIMEKDASGVEHLDHYRPIEEFVAEALEAINAK